MPPPRLPLSGGRFANAVNGERGASSDGTFRVKCGAGSAYTPGTPILSDFARSGANIVPSFYYHPPSRICFCWEGHRQPVTALCRGLCFSCLRQPGRFCLRGPYPAGPPLALRGRRSFAYHPGRHGNILRRPIGINLHLLIGFGAFLAEGRSLDALIYAILTMFAAANLPALLGLLALWRGRPRDLWALFAFVLGVCSVVPAVYCLNFCWQDGGAAWPFYAAAGLPMVLGLWVCAWVCRRWCTPQQPAPPRA